MKMPTYRPKKKGHMGRGVWSFEGIWCNKILDKGEGGEKREDQSYKDILGTLNQVTERLDDDKIDLRKYKLETEAEGKKFRDILLQV